jgi:hypothetical protein
MVRHAHTARSASIGHNELTPPASLLSALAVVVRAVEIFTGRGPNGEGVIGSREQKKWVKEYDDYRIETSKRWKLLRYHFVSLDTWLEGTCKSFCRQHDWKKLNRTRRSPTSKKSVFASQTDSPQSDAEEGASDHDSDNDSCVVKPN